MPVFHDDGQMALKLFPKGSSNLTAEEWNREYCRDARADGNQR